MKRLLISAAIAGLTSTSAFAGSPGAMSGVLGSGVNITVSPVTNVTTQIATTVGVIVAPTTIISRGSVLSAPVIVQSLSAINLNRTMFWSGAIHY